MKSLVRHTKNSRKRSPGRDMSTMCAKKAGASSGFLRNGVTAHRGDSIAFPPNTIAAFESALGLGVDWIELDVRRTADGKLVVLHDARTKNVADLDLRVSECDYEQLKLADVAYRHRERHRLSLDECPEAGAPLLEDVLNLVLSQRRARVSIQPKDWCVDEAVDLVRRKSAVEWVGFNDSSFAKMVRVKELCGAIPVFWDRYPVFFLGQDVARAKEFGFESMVIHYLGVTKNRVDRIHRSGLEVGAWTVNGRRRLRRLIEMGVDRIYTDEPELLLRLRASTACSG